LFAKSFNGDAFSDEMRQKVVTGISKDLKTIDLVVYSLASPRRVDPRTGKVNKSVLKPLGQPYTNKTIDFDKSEVTRLTLPPATQEEIDQTVKVMGGEDWEFWIDALMEGGVLAKGFRTLAYSYIGPQVTQTVYRHGTIGAAKDHLEKTAKKLDQKLKSVKGKALISVNKALVTQSSSAIPFIPLYFILLMKVMKMKNLHEECIQQIYRLFSTKLYSGKSVPLDEEGRIRMDDWELKEDVQKEVMQNWEKINSKNLKELADLDGYHEDFLKLFGFGFSDVAYEADVDHALYFSP